MWRHIDKGMTRGHTRNALSHKDLQGRHFFSLDPSRLRPTSLYNPASHISNCIPQQLHRHFSFPQLFRNITTCMVPVPCPPPSIISVPMPLVFLSPLFPSLLPYLLFSISQLPSRMLGPPSPQSFIFSRAVRVNMQVLALSLFPCSVDYIKNCNNDIRAGVISTQQRRNTRRRTK